MNWLVSHPVILEQSLPLKEALSIHSESLTQTLSLLNMNSQGPSDIWGMPPAQMTGTK